MKKFIICPSEKKYRTIEDQFYTIGLIAAAALMLMNKENFIDYKSFLIFGAAFILTWKFKVHPILMIALAGVAGLILYW